MESMSTPRVTPPPVDVGDIVVDRPPELPRATPANPVARLLPVAMLVAAAGMVALYLTSGVGSRSPMMAFLPIMMVVSVLGSSVYGMRGNRRNAELDEGRREYLRYLRGLGDATVRTAAAQHRSMHWSHPEPAALWTLAGGERTGERRHGDADFGHVRVGVGVGPLSTPLVDPGTGPRGDVDPVSAGALRALLEHRSTVPDLPITVDLCAYAEVTIDGIADAARGVARAIVCQLAAFHDPGEVVVAALVDDASAAYWDWLKWLPHHQHAHRLDRAGAMRLTYLGRMDVATVARAGHLVIVVDGGELTGEIPTEGVTVVSVGTTPVFGGCRPTLRLDADGDDAVAVPDVMAVHEATTCARRLASGHTSFGTGRRRPARPGWTDLVGIEHPMELDAARSWQARSGDRRLRVPVGLSDGGEPVELDLKEAAHGGMGPHGLCVGATGSGKSEFLRTLALGLVATHSPDALNLALVDFKGGATFLGFERLRHVAAVITNLADEAHLVSRMRDALAGEITRRQETLRTFGNFANIGEYEAARAEGVALAPLPVLLIIVDEFSELLAQQPDLAELFVAIGRVGRSLGMHLLLASQRLDEGRLRGLETHLSYRVCLKTFSASDSRAVLGTADAYDLPNTPGMGYLKTAAGQLIRFHTSWVSGRVAAHPGARSAQSVSLPTLFTAAPAGPVPDDGPAREGGASGTVLGIILDRLAGQGAPAHQVWSPPLDQPPALDAVLAAAPRQSPLVVPIGLVDRPFEQRCDVLFADTSGAGGHVAVVGGPRSGKSTALRTLILALAAGHSPAAVQIYGLDFGGGALTGSGSLPHVGAVAGRFEADLCRRIVAQLQALVARREARLRRDGPDAGFDDPYGHVYLVVDGWAAARQELDWLEEAVTALTGQGLAVGVHVVLSASRWVDLRPALRDQIATRVELRLGDPAESEMDRRRARMLADRPPGRGITCDGLELVIALPRLDGTPTVVGLDGAFRDAAERLTRRDGRRAPPVDLLPAMVPRDAVVGSGAGATRIPLGMGDDELEPVAVDFGCQPHLVILGEPECGKTAALRTLCRGIADGNDAAAVRVVLVDPRRTLLGVVEGDLVVGYSTSAEAARAHVSELVVDLRGRLPGPDVTQAQLRKRSWWTGPEVYVIVDDYDLVADAVAGNPMSALLDLLPHAGDVGLHVVVARRSGGAARAMFDPVLARLRDLGCMALMMSTRPEEGPLFGALRPSVRPPGRGILVRRGHTDQLVQVAWTDPA